MPANALMGETPHVDVLMGIDCRRSASLGRAALSPVCGRLLRIMSAAISTCIMVQNFQSPLAARELW